MRKTFVKVKSKGRLLLGKWMNTCRSCNGFISHPSILSFVDEVVIDVEKQNLEAIYVCTNMLRAFGDAFPDRSFTRLAIILIQKLSGSCEHNKF